MSNQPFNIQYLTTVQFGTAEVRIDGGDFFRIISSSLPLNLVFYDIGNTGKILGRASGVLAGLSLDFRSLSSENKVNGNGDIPRKFGQIGITASAPVTPILLVVEGIKADSSLIAGIVSSVGAGSVNSLAQQVLADTATYTYAANAGRRDIYIQNDAGSAGNLLVVAGALANGVKLIPGQGIPFDNYTGSVQVYANGACNVNAFEVLN